MNPEFRWFVEEASKAGIKDFIVRSNLTIILANKKIPRTTGILQKAQRSRGVFSSVL